MTQAGVKYWPKHLPWIFFTFLGFFWLVLFGLFFLLLFVFFLFVLAGFLFGWFFGLFTWRAQRLICYGVDLVLGLSDVTATLPLLPLTLSSWPWPSPWDVCPLWNNHPRPTVPPPHSGEGGLLPGCSLQRSGFFFFFPPEPPELLSVSLA